ncbi:MAG: PAS domain S-box protein, partial [Nitrospinota bacterium]
MAPLHLLLIDDDPDDRLLVMRALHQEFSDLRVTQISDGDAFQQALVAQNFDLVITDYRLRWGDGLQVLEAVKARWPDCPVIMFTGTGSEEIAVAAMKAGLDDYILKSPQHFVRLPAAVQSALERAALSRRTRALENRYQQLFANLPVGIYRTTVEGEVLEANPAGLRIMGFSSFQEARQSSVPALYLDPHDRERFLQQLQEQGRVADWRVRLRRPDGTTFWAELHATLIRDAEGKPRFIDGILEDVTRLVEVEEALHRSRQEYEALVNSIDGIVWEMDARTWQFSFVSRQAERILGYPVAQWINEPDFWPRHVHPEDRERTISSCRQATQAKEDHVLEYRMLAADGREVWIRDLVTVVVENDQPVKLRGIMVDITEQKRVEEERAYLEAQLFQAQKMEAVGRLAGGIAHDFNNLLTVISGYSELLLEHIGAHEQWYREILEIRKAAERAATLTRHLLTFSRHQIVEPRVLDLNVLIANLQEMLRRLISENIDLRLHLAPGLGQIKADPSQMEQLVVNLVLNARDAMPDGGRISIETANVELDEAYARRHARVTPGPYILLQVSDTGCGMDAETLSHIFEPFFTTKEVGQGTGLGLAIVYGIVEQGKGHIAVESQPGEGTVFRVYWPRVTGV